MANKYYAVIRVASREKSIEFKYDTKAEAEAKVTEVLASGFTDDKGDDVFYFPASQIVHASVEKRGG